MKIIITGASGFIGRYLIRFFTDLKFKVVALSRQPQKLQTSVPSSVSCLPWKNLDPLPWINQLNEPSVIINLIGENIAGQLWTKAYKEKLRKSRIDSVSTIKMALEEAPGKQAHVLVQASAVGYYGNTSQVVDETAAVGNDFFANLVVEWEKASEEVEALGTRRIVCRLGVVLGHGGALQKMLLPFRLFLGGPFGSGRQGFPWIHIDDVAQTMLFLIERPDLSGAFNFVAPQLVNQKEFCRTLGQVLRRPCWLPVPAPVLKLFLGEMARVALLSGQFVRPRRLLEAGYEFRFSELKQALEDILT